MGISVDDSVRAAMSASMMNIAPSRTAIGNSFQWLVPTSPRAMCGMINPTNPMIPHLHTMNAMMTEVMMM